MFLRAQRPGDLWPVSSSGPSGTEHNDLIQVIYMLTSPSEHPTGQRSLGKPANEPLTMDERVGSQENWGKMEHCGVTGGQRRRKTVWCQNETSSAAISRSWRMKSVIKLEIRDLLQIKPTTNLLMILLHILNCLIFWNKPKALFFILDQTKQNVKTLRRCLSVNDGGDETRAGDLFICATCKSVLPGGDAASQSADSADFW